MINACATTSKCQVLLWMQSSIKNAAALPWDSGSHSVCRLHTDLKEVFKDALHRMMGCRQSMRQLLEFVAQFTQFQLQSVN